MTRILSHIPFASAAVRADVRPRATAWMYETGRTEAKVPNPNALALRHAP